MTWFLKLFLASPAASPVRTRAVALEWKVVSVLSGLLTGLIVRKAMTMAWERLSSGSSEPPDPGDRRVGWFGALSWAAATGASLGVARLVGARVAARAWEAATGDSPPGVAEEH